jgi:hypothetical protein
MANNRLLALADSVEAASSVDSALSAAIEAGLREAFPEHAGSNNTPDGIAVSTDLLVALMVAELPGWHLSIHGRARPLGRWTCTLRRSDVLDDDEIIGTSEAHSLSQAVLAAVLRVAGRR